MSEFPLGYERIAPATWVYLSSLLMIGLFFKFNRLWSVRNLDLILLILLAPGLLLVVKGSQLTTDPAGPAAMVAGEGFLANELGDDRGRQTNEPSRGDGASASPADTAEPSSATGDAAQQNDSAGDAKPSAAGGQTATATAQDGKARWLADRVQRGRAMQLTGFIWLLLVGVLLVVRLLVDPMMTRRPLLEPNLSTGGLIFIGCSLFVFLMANVITSRPTKEDLEGPRSAEQLVSGVAADSSDQSLTRYGPGYAVIHILPSLPTVATTRKEDVPRGIGTVRTWSVDGQQIEAEYVGTGDDGQVILRQPQDQLRRVPLASLGQADRAYVRKLAAYTVIAKVMAILGHLAVVLGIALIGYVHFGNLKMGVGAATLYLMLPYTAMMTGRVDHVIPAALLVWAVFFYRRPLVAGILIGLAAGVLYYPLFLLPLWISFYWHRGLWRFVAGVVPMLVLLALSLVFVSTDWPSFVENLRKMFGIWLPIREGLQGLWALGWDPVFRLPLLVGFGVMSATLGFWPAQKNLGTLFSCSAALMVATQFWHGFGGGLYMGWYLPLTLLTIFRPNLEDRVALTVLGEGWLSRRKNDQVHRPGIAA